MTLKGMTTFRPHKYYRMRYFWYREHCPLVEHRILLESIQGKQPLENVATILEELATNPLYAKYEIYLSSDKKFRQEREAYLKRHGIEKRVTLVDTESNHYYKLLATAKYLISETSLLYIYTKREGQVYLNTWHGTPLKTLGKKIKQDFAGIGNAQHNLLTADYLLYPNEFTRNLMIEDYMLSNLGHAKEWLTGYPRNSVFLSDNRREQIRKECGIEQMEVYAYLPTWRGVIGKVTSEQQNARLYEYLKELDGKLKDNQRVYVKLHPVSVKDIDLSAFHKVLPFPAQDYDTYEFLNATDGLITDYSSVFFDYAVSRRKIILFTYDKEEYIADALERRLEEILCSMQGVGQAKVMVTLASQGEKIVEKDIPLETAVGCATINAAKSVNLYDQYGSITPGKVGNVVLLNEDLSLNEYNKKCNHSIVTV